MCPPQAHDGTHQTFVLGLQWVFLALQPCGAPQKCCLHLFSKGDETTFLSADEPEAAQASLSMSAMFIQITWGIPADRLGCIFMAFFSQSRCRQQLKCVISHYAGTIGDVAAPSFALALHLCVRESKKWFSWKLWEFFWSFRHSIPRSYLHENTWMWVDIQGGLGKSHHGAKGWVAPISCSSNYYLNYPKIIMQSLSRLLFCDTSSVWFGAQAQECPSWLDSFQGQMAKTIKVLYLLLRSLSLACKSHTSNHKCFYCL